MATVALDLLLGSQAPSVLSAAIGGYGGRLEKLRVDGVHVQPGGAAVVTYMAVVLRADGARTDEVLAAATGSRIPPGAAVIAGEHRGEPVEVGIWRWPQDPALPALTVLADPSRLAEVLRGFGLPATPALGICVRSYRPTRHAVVEVTAGRHTWFLKVVRPSAVAGLCTRHALTCPHLPVPPVIASTPDGLIVLPRADGTMMRSLITSDKTLPPPEALEKLLDSLPDEVVNLPPRPSHLQRLHGHADVLRTTAATEPTVLARLDEVTDALHNTDPGCQPTVSVHGDFYDGQLLVEWGRVTGLLDIDTVGPGHRVDDWATLLAHLSGLTLRDGCRKPAQRFAADVVAHVTQHISPSALRQHTAAALVGFATGPFRVQQQHWPLHTVARLDLARHWLAGTVCPT